MADGVECFECQAISVSDDDSIPCDYCLSDNTAPVYIRPCPAPDPHLCESDDHHWGRGEHVISVQQ